jgi:rhamnosyltransferase subunit B
MRIVIATWGSFGDLHPYMALALELKRRAHTPVIASIPIYKDKVEHVGIRFHPVRPDFPPTDQMMDIIRRAVDAHEGPRTIFSEMIAPHFRETYEDTLAAVEADGGADLIVSHMVTMAAPIVAEKTGRRWASTVLAPISFLSAYDPPSMPQIPGWRRLTTLHPSIARGLWTIGKRVSRPWVASVDKLREDVGLAPGKHPIFDGQHSPHLVLAMFSSVLAKIQPDFPANTRITGYAFYDGEAEQSAAPELLRFLEEGEPPILFTLGSSAVWLGEDFFRTSIEAARRLKRRAILLIGDKRNLPAAPLPQGIAAFDYAPFGQVMPKAACIVHQGGIGTTGQALRAGRPMLIMPFGHDTVDNARRCAELGVARIVFQKRYVAENVAAELHELLENPDYGERASVIGEKVRAENGTAAACDALEELMEVR